MGYPVDLATARRDSKALPARDRVKVRLCRLEVVE
jgi:hypothetical protein